MITIATGNQKGGVGKSATTQALGYGLAAAGLRVILVDADPQASLTQASGVRDAGGRSLAEVIGGATPGGLALADIAQEIGPRLELAPASAALAGAELALTSRIGRENVLRKALAGVARRYDVALIDCPPSLGLLTIAALAAAQGVIIPTPPQAQDIRGLALFTDTLAQVKAELNPGIEVIGVLITFYDGRYTHHQAALKTIQESGLPVFPELVRRSIRVAESANARQPIQVYSPGSPIAQAYNQITERVITWLENRQAI